MRFDSFREKCHGCDSSFIRFSLHCHLHTHSLPLNLQIPMYIAYQYPIPDTQETMLHYNMQTLERTKYLESFFFNI